MSSGTAVSPNCYWCLHSVFLLGHLRSIYIFPRISTEVRFVFFKCASLGESQCCVAVVWWTTRSCLVPEWIEWRKHRRVHLRWMPVSKRGLQCQCDREIQEVLVINSSDSGSHVILVFGGFYACRPCGGCLDKNTWLSFWQPKKYKRSLCLVFGKVFLAKSRSYTLEER